MKNFICLISLLALISFASCDINAIPTVLMDNNTYSDYTDVSLNSYNLDAELNFTTQQMVGQMNLTFTANVLIGYVQLDIWNLNVIGTFFNGNNVTDYTNIVQYPGNVEGSQLQIYFGKTNLVLNKTVSKGNQFQISVIYNTVGGISNEAFQWLQPEQTSTKTLPYVYTQCQTIQCRSVFPILDTPGVKAPWTASITVPNGISVFMSANQTGSVPTPGRTGFTTFSFQQHVPVPSYLFALVAGNLVQQQIGGASSVCYVISEPDSIQYYEQELSLLNVILASMESYIGSYNFWGIYRAVIMPPNFPLDKMENPLLNFFSPAIMSGDMSDMNVVMNSMAHSWFGNTITCKNWTNIWINDGISTFLERKTENLLFGQDYYETESIIGNYSLTDDIQSYGASSTFSSLFPITNNINPNQVVSNVPREKGFQFMIYLENLIGATYMQGFLKQFLTAYNLESLGVEDFQSWAKSYITTQVPGGQALFSQIDWNAWIYVPGLPPVTANFYTQNEIQANELAEAFIDLGGSAFPFNYQQFNLWNANVQKMFLEYLNANHHRVTAPVARQLQIAYNFNNFQNQDIKWRWFRTSILARYYSNYDYVQNFIAHTGRIDFIEPIYQALVDVGQRNTAIQWYSLFQSFYHPMAQEVLMADLGI